MGNPRLIGNRIPLLKHGYWERWVSVHCIRFMLIGTASPSAVKPGEEMEKSGAATAPIGPFRPTCYVAEFLAVALLNINNGVVGHSSRSGDTRWGSVPTSVHLQAKAPRTWSRLEPHQRRHPSSVGGLRKYCMELEDRFEDARLQAVLLRS